MSSQLDPDTPLDDLIQQFRLAAAEVQTAYHQLEQELLVSGEDTWETAPAPSGLALPNLAPLYLVGTLVSGLSKASLVINQDLNVVSANNEAQKDFGLGESTSLTDILAPKSVELLQKLIDESASHDGVELKARNGGSTGIFDCIYLDNPIEKGRMLLLVAQELEIDHIREVEDQILKNLTGTLVHEIRTPLTSMQGFAELLLQVQNLDPKESNKLNIIRGGIDRLSLLASALGTVFQETLEPHWIKVDIPAFLRHMIVDYCSTKALSTDIIQLVDGSEAIQVVTDPGLVQLALEQVLNNAVEAMDNIDSSDIKIAMQNTEEEITISVRNGGQTATESDGSDWWIPFYTTKSGHLGLGLVRVRRIMEALGGSAQITLLGEGGVELNLTLPI
ncbi:sensor histidine kinase [Candidatus Neomarinimicrobiota bacterium]